MRCLALALAATGCNWIYGLEPTVAIDASISELPPGERTGLVWAIATTDGTPQAPGVDPQLVYKAIGSETTLRPMAPTVLVGDDESLVAAEYNLGDGTFEIPYALRESPHRILYTLPPEAIGHEVQWALTNAYLVVPRTTRFEAPNPPMNSGYTITPVGLMPTNTLVAPALYTSGAFTFSNEGIDFMQNGSSVTFQFAKDATPLAGPAGAPQLAQGDWVMLAEWRGLGPQSFVDSFALTQVDLMPGVMSAPVPEPAWQTPTYRNLSTICMSMPTECLPQIASTDSETRLNAAVTGTLSRKMQYGVSPSTDLPGFLLGVAPTFVERPLIMPFAESIQFDSSLALADPSPQLALDRVFTARLSSSRTLTGGATLVSSLQAMTKVFDQPLKFAAPLARNVQLGSTSLSGTTDGTMIAQTSGMVQLTFEPESMYSADVYVITLYSVNGAAITPVRYFHVLAPSVKVEGSLLEVDTEYVFGITAHTGFSGVDRGDFGKATYPFSSSTTFTRTFKVK